jgi:hypothetical protein
MFIVPFCSAASIAPPLEDARLQGFGFLAFLFGFLALALYSLESCPDIGCCAWNPLERGIENRLGHQAFSFVGVRSERASLAPSSSEIGGIFLRRDAKIHPVMAYGPFHSANFAPLLSSTTAKQPEHQSGGTPKAATVKTFPTFRQSLQHPEGLTIITKSPTLIALNRSSRP